jgi:hypothetical protein
MRTSLQFHSCRRGGLAVALAVAALAACGEEFTEPPTAVSAVGGTGGTGR